MPPASIFSVRGVRVIPGATAFTRIDRAESSRVGTCQPRYCTLGAAVPIGATRHEVPGDRRHVDDRAPSGGPAARNASVGATTQAAITAIPTSVANGVAEGGPPLQHQDTTDGFPIRRASGPSPRRPRPDRRHPPSPLPPHHRGRGVRPPWPPRRRRRGPTQQPAPRRRSRARRPRGRSRSRRRSRSSPTPERN